MAKSIKVSAVILAAGIGSRMDMPTTKQKLNICSKSVLERSVEAFSKSSYINEIIVVIKDDELDFAKAELLGYDNVKIVFGGATRAISAKNGFNAVSNGADFVAIHDGARCLITPEMINKVLSSAFEYGCASAGARVTDTIKLAENGFITGTVDRDRLCSVQTPQVFSYSVYKDALSVWDKDVTDDNALVERLGKSVKLVEIGRENIKITTKEDLLYAEYIIKEREKCAASE